MRRSALKVTLPSSNAGHGILPLLHSIQRVWGKFSTPFLLVAGSERSDRILPDTLVFLAKKLFPQRTSSGDEEDPALF